MERSAIDLHDQARRSPAQVGFFASDPRVEFGESLAGIAEDLQSANLSAAAGTMERQGRVAAEHIREAARATLTVMRSEGVRDAARGSELQTDGLPHRSCQGACRDVSG